MTVMTLVLLCHSGGHILIHIRHSQHTHNADITKSSTVRFSQSFFMQSAHHDLQVEMKLK